MGTTEKVYANDLLEREVLDLSAGMILGSIVDYVITGDGVVSLIGILGERWFAGGSGIPPSTITNINAQRITIVDSGEITTFEPDGEDSFSVNTDTFIWGKNVLADSGELLGGLMDFCFNLSDGVITDLVVMDGAEKRQKVPIDKLLTIGRDYIVIARGSGDSEEAADINPAASSYTTPGTYSAAEAEAPEDAADESAVGLQADDSAGAADESAVRAALSRFDQKKYDYLINKRAHRDISDADGDVIAAKGTPLDDAALGRIVDSNQLSRVFIELTAKS